MMGLSYSGKSVEEQEKSEREAEGPPGGETTIE